MSTRTACDTGGASTDGPASLVQATSGLVPRRQQHLPEGVLLLWAGGAAPGVQEQFVAGATSDILRGTPVWSGSSTGRAVTAHAPGGRG